MYYPDVGNSISDSGPFYAAIFKGASCNHLPICVPLPPTKEPAPLASYIYSPFNTREHAVSLSRHHDDFEAAGCRLTDPTAVATPTKPSRAKYTCNLYRKDDDARVSTGASVFDTSWLWPPFFLLKFECIWLCFWNRIRRWKYNFCLPFFSVLDDVMFST